MEVSSADATSMVGRRGDDRDRRRGVLERILTKPLGAHVHRPRRVAVGVGIHLAVGDGLRLESPVGGVGLPRGIGRRLFGDQRQHDPLRLAVLAG